MNKLYKKRYGIYDMLHKSFFYFTVEDDKYKSFVTKEDAKIAIKFCYMMFFTKPHKFVIKPVWERIDDI